MISFELKVILIFITSCLGAIFVLPKLSHIAQRVGLLDHPNSRKVHTSPRPLVGGIGMVVAATFSSLTFITIQGLRGFFLGLSVLLLIGFFDDFREVGHRQKFLAQIFATGLMIYFSQVLLRSFGDLIGIGELVVPGGEIVVWLVTIFCVVGVINAINLIDGLDGLAGGIAFIAFTIFAIHASLADDKVLMLLNLAFAGAVLGFLRFNWHPAVLFMGDAGSLCLGFTLAFMALALTQPETSSVTPVTALLVLTVPITDTLIVMFKRVISGRSPFAPDKYHLHHIFLRYGLGRATTVRVILALSLLFGCISFLGPVYKIEEKWLFLIFIIYFTSYFILSFYIVGFFKYSIKVRKQIKLCAPESLLLKILFGFFDFFHLFRKTKRYPVSLKLSYSTSNGNVIGKGEIVNISQCGCMAFIEGFDTKYEEVILQIETPGLIVAPHLEVKAEHLWSEIGNDSYSHGFQFFPETLECVEEIEEIIEWIKQNQKINNKQLETP